MLFDQARELPIATVRRARGARVGLLVGDFRRWMTAHWQWLRPRTVPVLVAVAGMFAMLHSVSYLARPFQRSMAISIEADLASIHDGPGHCAPRSVNAMRAR